MSGWAARGATLVLCGALGGCIVPIIVGDGRDEGSGTTTGANGSSADSDVSAPGTTVANPVGTSSGGQDDGTTGGTTDGSSADTGAPVGSVCDPQPQGINTWFSVTGSGRQVPEFEPFERDVSCVVKDIQPMTAGQTIVLDCPDDEQFSIDVTTGDSVPTLPLNAKDTVRLRMIYAPGLDTAGARHVAISEPGEGGALLLGLYLIGPQTYVDDVADWFAPLTFSRVDDVCELEPYDPPEPPDDTSFIARPCSYQVQRQAYDFVLDGGEPQRVFDQRIESIGTYEIWLEGARRSFPQEEECGAPDGFSDWTNFVIVGAG